MRLNSIKPNAMLRGRTLKASLLSGVLCVAMGFSSCDSIYDDDPNCRLGVALRFVYEYHMERGANAFMSNVDCVNVIVFDKDGNYLAQYSETSDVLQKESYRMELPLEVGDYHFVVYGGTACEHATFELTPDWATGSRSEGYTKDDLRVTLPRNNQGVSDKQLHDLENRTGGLFYGVADVSLTEDDIDVDYKEATVYLMKNTNNIQVILQEISSPYTIDYADYNFQIVDDNFVLDGYNNVIEIATDDYQPSYLPYAMENRIMGYVEPGVNNGQKVEEDENRPVQVACAEFSTSRLLIDHLATARLIITSNRPDDEEKQIVNIPLITYLSAIQGFGDNWIKGEQEFLDRQSRWTLMFFLQRGSWIQARISVNWWTVRINNAEF